MLDCNSQFKNHKIDSIWQLIEAFTLLIHHKAEKERESQTAKVDLEKLCKIKNAESNFYKNRDSKID